MVIRFMKGVPVFSMPVLKLEKPPVPIMLRPCMKASKKTHLSKVEEKNERSTEKKVEPEEFQNRSVQANGELSDALQRHLLSCTFLSFYFRERQNKSGKEYYSRSAEPYRR